MTTLTVKPKNKRELLAIKRVLEGFKVQFEMNEEKEKPYNPEFVASVLQGREDYKQGKCETIALDDIWK
jgi:hypothetical protein